MAGRHPSGTRRPLTDMGMLPASSPPPPPACSIPTLRLRTQRVPGSVFLAPQAEDREMGCVTSTGRDEAQIFKHVEGGWEHGDGVQDGVVTGGWGKHGPRGKGCVRWDRVG